VLVLVQGSSLVVWVVALYQSLVQLGLIVADDAGTIASKLLLWNYVEFRI
jgi:hypothetical protein